MTVYLKEINGQLIAAPNKDINLLIDEGYQAYNEDDYSAYLIGEKIFANNRFIDTPTEEYKAKQKAKNITNLQLQMDILDLKSIRALREGGIKDESTNLSWLDYYKQQIQELRNELKEL